MKASDFLARELQAAGVTHVFGVQGGSVVHVFDSLEATDITVHYCVSEYFAAFAALAQSRASGNLGCCVVTTGPAGTNALTGLLSAWQDSVPVVFVSGQTRSGHMSYGTNVRQIGSQESPICDVVRPITKIATAVSQASELPKALEAVLDTARQGRPGPVWLDIPVDVQWGEVADSPLARTNPHDTRAGANDARQAAADIIIELAQATRPVVWVGAGVLRAQAVDAFRSFVEQADLPFVTTWQTKCLLGANHRLDLGVVGPFGQAGANAATYDCDLILGLGTHFSVNQTTSNSAAFTPQARKILVNIDPYELSGLQVPAAVQLQCDVKEVLTELTAALPADVTSFSASEQDVYRSRNRASAALDSLALAAIPLVNSNAFLRDVFKAVDGSYEVVIDGGGTALYAGFQACYQGELRGIHCSTAISAMGTAFAETGGLAAVSTADHLFAIIGDGSFWMSLSDLPSLNQLDRPVTVIVVNNDGYLAIRHTQQEFLGARFYGTDSSGRLHLPEIGPTVTGIGAQHLLVTAKNVPEAVALARQKRTRGLLVLEVKTPRDQALLFRQVFVDNGDGTKSPLPLREMAT
ncbi:MAG: thiamine pyrophosphate-binding protein [Actinomycetota bacterium]|nr:thiamine pyrophosphate-binding protein [Actinomycetota bacterium]